MRKAFLMGLSAGGLFAGGLHANQKKASETTEMDENLFLKK